MLGKLCVCGHEMKPQGKQTLEMNGSSLGSNIWTDHVLSLIHIFSKKHEFQKGMIVPLAKMKRTGYNESHGTDL